MSPESERVFVDTNILIYSTFEDFEPEKHVHCTDILDKLQKSGTTLFISSQILREFFAISTNQNIFKKPLTYKQAVTKMKEFIARFTIVNEKEYRISHTLYLVDTVSI